MYFYYGITHSTLDSAQTEEIELTVDQSYVQQQSAGASASTGGGGGHQTTAVWDRHGYENKMADDSWSQGKSWTSKAGPAPAPGNNTWGKNGDPKSSTSGAGVEGTAPAKSVPGGFGIFVDETQFPTWDD